MLKWAKGSSLKSFKLMAIENTMFVPICKYYLELTQGLKGTPQHKKLKDLIANGF